MFGSPFGIRGTHTAVVRHESEDGAGVDWGIKTLYHMLDISAAAAECGFSRVAAGSVPLQNSSCRMGSYSFCLPLSHVGHRCGCSMYWALQWAISRVILWQSIYNIIIYTIMELKKTFVAASRLN